MNKPTSLIIGSGIIGLCIARSISPHCSQTIVIDSESRILSGISSRSSQVIHSGIYEYPPNKRYHCGRGRDLLYDYCKKFKIPHRKTGKYLVANTDAQCEYLDNIAKKTRLPNSEFYFTKNELIKAKSALFVKSSGILDVFELGNSFLSQCSSTDIALNCTFIDAEYRNKKWNCRINSCGAEDTLQFDIVVNAAGLSSAHVAQRLSFPTCRIVYAKGHYCKYVGKKLKGIDALIYPVPNCKSFKSLGVHLTLDLEGGIRFGPDFELTASLDYTFRGFDKETFLKSIQEYLPSVSMNDLEHDYVGIRPRLEGDSNDFIIEIDAAKRAVSCVGIESPGITSCLSIAQHVEEGLFC